MPTVIVNSSSDVTIDGVSVGNISDAFLNHRDDAGAIFDGITAYEESLRQAGADAVAAVTEDLHKADAKVAELQAQARDAAAAHDAELEALRTACNEHVAQAQAAYDASIAAANATVADCQQRATAAETLANAHGQLSLTLMNQGSSDAAVAAVQEITRLNRAREKLELEAKLAALPKD